MITITLETTNNAFAVNRNSEVVRILRELADNYADHPDTNSLDLIDRNGNTVGDLIDDGPDDYNEDAEL